MTAYDCFARVIADGGKEAFTSKYQTTALPNHPTTALPNHLTLSSLVWRDTLAETREAKDAARETAIRLVNDLAATDRAALAALERAKDAEWTPDYERRLADGHFGTGALRARR